jgi:hypothetical protein
MLWFTNPLSVVILAVIKPSTGRAGVVMHVLSSSQTGFLTKQLAKFVRYSAKWLVSAKRVLRDSKHQHLSRNSEK